MRVSHHRRPLWALLLAALAGASGPVLAATGARAADQTVVMFAASEHRDDSLRAIQAVRGQFSDLPVRLEVVWVERLSQLPRQVALARQKARQTGAFAVVWCDLSEGDKVYLYLAEPEHGRVLVRDVRQAPGAGRFETVAIITRSSVAALLSGGAIGVRRSRGHHRLGLSLGYAVDGLASDGMIFHGVRLGAQVWLSAHWAAFLAARWVQPDERASTSASVRLSRYPISAGARLRWPLGRRAWVSGSLAATVEVVAAEVTLERSGLSRQPETDATYFSLGPRVGLGLTLWGPLAVEVTLGGDIVLNNRRYVVERTDGTEIVIDPWPVRPALETGLVWRFF